MTPSVNLKFSIIRTSESTFGNFICDLTRKEVSADCCLLASGSIRADKVYAAGHHFTYGDAFDIYPFEKELCLIEILGEDIYRGLELGVSKYPALEGRFPNVSRIQFEFNPQKPQGQRVNRDTILIGGKPLNGEKTYKMALCNFLADGKDGYEPFKNRKHLIDENSRKQIRSLIIDFFSNLRSKARSCPAS